MVDKRVIEQVLLEQLGEFREYDFLKFGGKRQNGQKHLVENGKLQKNIWWGV